MISRNTFIISLIISFMSGSQVFADEIGNTKISSFRKAKKILLKKVHHDHRIAFYSKCKFSMKKKVDKKSCGYTARKNAKRGGRIEWEHIMPAWEIGHQLKCWQNGGRKNCNRTNLKFRLMASDMHNLRPAIGELNGDRRHYRFNMIEGEPRKYGAVDFEVDFKQRVAEPAPHIRGDIARTYFYMAKAYGIRISKSQRKLFEVWHKQDPVDD